MSIRNFSDIAFTESVKQVQNEKGSRKHYERMGEVEFTELGYREKDFIASLDMFYMATVSDTNWPYLQYRGGKRGFLKVLSDTQLGYADFRGNMQYISTGNLTVNNRVLLFLMDYTRRMRLKIWATTEIISADDPRLQKLLIDEDYGARIERFIIFNVKAYDWNCPQHITPRFTVEEITQMLANGTIKLDDELLKKLNGE